MHSLVSFLSGEHLSVTFSGKPFILFHMESSHLFSSAIRTLIRRQDTQTDGKLPPHKGSLGTELHLPRGQCTGSGLRVRTTTLWCRTYVRFTVTRKLITKKSRDKQRQHSREGWRMRQREGGSTTFLCSFRCKLLITASFHIYWMLLNKEDKKRGRRGREREGGRTHIHCHNSEGHKMLAAGLH